MTEDAIDAMIERVAREEQEEIDKAHGQSILDAVAAKERGEDPLIQALNKAHQAKAEAETE